MAEGSSGPRVGFVLIGVITSAAVAVTAAVTSAGAHATTGASGGAAALAALGRAIVVGIPIAVALYAWRQPAHARFGRALLVVSSVWFLASLSASSSSLPYSVGRVSGWLAEAGIVYIVLAFPDGRLRYRIDRTLVAVSVALAALLFLPTALFVEHYPAPSPWSSCYHACPHNAFMAVGRPPAFINSVIDPLRELIAEVVFLIVAGLLFRRIRSAGSLMRRTLTPVLVVAIVRLLALVAGLSARRVSPDSALTEAAMWTVALLLPVLALAFLVGLVRWHLFVTAGSRTVNARLRDMPGPEQVQGLLAYAFEDPGLRIASWSDQRHRWIDASGAVLEQPDAASGQHLTEVRQWGRPTVAIRHDVALAHDPTFVATAAAAASVACASDRIALQTSDLVRELEASRARMVAAADSERQRIERDLHDGAQQHLVGLCIQLELAAERAESDNPAEAAELRKLIAHVELALDEIRSLTRGIYPAMLTEHGLEAAVRAAARRSTVPATVEAKDLGEYPDEIATAVYFCCVEGLQNIAKHAVGARSARIVLQESDSTLSFSVSDDGPGMEQKEARVGDGLINMRDRMSTVGGKLTVWSHPGQGTQVSGRVPLAAIPRSERRDERLVRPASPVRRRDHVEP